MRYIHRYIEPTIANILHSFPVLYVVGPRQVGKTTVLQRMAAKMGVQYVTLDDMSLRLAAQNDPGFFLQQYPQPLFIDEAQYAPQLFPYIKMRVQQTGKNGQYWLTGSQQFSMVRHIQESLAGRVGIVNLLGLSASEIRGESQQPKPFFPNQHFLVTASAETVQQLFQRIWTGSFPALWKDTQTPIETFYSSYIQTYIDRDITELFGVEKKSEFYTVLQLCAARTGQILNMSELSRDAGVAVPTVREWLSILEQTRQIVLLHPYFPNRSQRLIKAPKLHMLDTGLAAYLTKWRSAETLQHGAMAGAFFETYVVSEVIKSYYSRGIEPPINYMRDKEGHEVDLVLEQDGQLVLLEVKLGAHINQHDVRHLHYMKKHYPTVSHCAVVTPQATPLSIDRTTQVIPVSTIQ